ncbi:Solute carrier family 12 member 4 [Taenia solium]|eukprot:TsM_001102600 transcript=TsM_001102600 gene=TsM_001102600
MKCQDVASKTDLQAVIDEHYVGVREGADGEMPCPQKPAKKPSIFKVFISGPAQDSCGNATCDERRESKSRTDGHLLSPVKGAKMAKDAGDKSGKGDVGRGKDDDANADAGADADDEGEHASEDDDRRSMNQHSVTFAEGGGGMKAKVEAKEKEKKKKKKGKGKEKENGGNDEEDESWSSTENSASTNQRLNEYTFSPPALRAAIGGDGESDNAEGLHSPSGKKTSSPRRLHSAKRLNELIVERSADAAAVLISLPALPKSAGSEFYYMEYVETLTDGLQRVILIRGSGREVITAFAE